MDKRRYVSRSPRNPRTPKGMDGDETGNPAVDGYTVRHRQPLSRYDRPDFSRREENYTADSLMDDMENRFSKIYGD